MSFPKQQLLDAVYQAIGVSATLGEETITVRDDTKGTSISSGAIVETIGPSARVRMKELTDKNISLSSLPTSTITFNGNSWRIKTYKPLPSPNGEADGQIRLMLLSEG